MALGRQSKTTVCLVYLKDIADEQLVAEVRRHRGQPERCSGPGSLV
ncbi:MAG: spore germination protein [Clostridia bacterium]|nr:spore germination protein [Clostridia bacterium]